MGTGKRTLGFRAGLAQDEAAKARDEILAHVAPDDLLEYGLIPEFVGRLPVIVPLQSLDKQAMVAILTEPKNALVKQFQRSFALDGVELVFTDDALEAVAEEAMRHKMGARSLRTVVEDTLLDVMYEIPSHPDIKKCVVDAEAIRGRRRAILLSGGGQVVEPMAEEARGETA